MFGFPVFIRGCSSTTLSYWQSIYHILFASLSHTHSFPIFSTFAKSFLLVLIIYLYLHVRSSWKQKKCVHPTIESQGEFSKCQFATVFRSDQLRFPGLPKGGKKLKVHEKCIKVWYLEISYSPKQCDPHKQDTENDQKIDSYLCKHKTFDFCCI